MWVYTFYIFWTHFCLLKSLFSNFRIITAIVSGVLIFAIFMGVRLLLNESPHDKKTTKWLLHQAKTQISLGICPVWSKSSLSAWRTLSPQLPIEHTPKTDQTGRMPRLIWVFAGRTTHFVGFVMRWLKWVGKRNGKHCRPASDCSLIWCSLIWVSTVCSDLSVPKLTVKIGTPKKLQLLSWN